LGGLPAWTVALFACGYLILAAPIALPFGFHAGYVLAHSGGHWRQTLPNWTEVTGAF
jgi:hypothetical protein